MAQKLLDVGITEEFLKDGISKQLNIEPNQVFVTKYTSSKIEGTGGIVGEAIFVDVEAKINDKTETCGQAPELPGLSGWICKSCN